VIARWAARTRGRDEERRTYLVFQVIQPYPDDAEAQRPADRPD
jgi:hypothetical protein